MTTLVEVVHDGGCGIDGQHLEKGARFEWDDVTHGDTLGSFIETGLLAVVPDEAVSGEVAPKSPKVPKAKKADAKPANADDSNAKESVEAPVDDKQQEVKSSAEGQTTNTAEQPAASV